MGNENDDLQNHQLLAAEAAGLLRLSQKISDLADKLAANCEKSETNEGRLWAKLQAAEKAKEEETAAKIEAIRKNADLLKKAETAEKAGEYANEQLSDALESIRKMKIWGKKGAEKLDALDKEIIDLEKENDALRQKLADALSAAEMAEMEGKHETAAKIEAYRKNADLLERAEAAEKAGEYVNAQLSDALQKNNALQKENDALRSKLREEEEEEGNRLAATAGRYKDLYKTEAAQNADLRQKLDAARAILRDALSDLG